MIEESGSNRSGGWSPAGFTHALDNHLAFYRSALVAYDYRCAISGFRFSPQNKILHERLDVVPIHPRELDGALDIGNALVLLSTLASAFAQGLITATDDGRVLVPRPGALTGDLPALVETGRALFLPADPALRPAAKYLQFHRLVIARYHG